MVFCNKIWILQRKQEIKPTTLESKESKFNAKILPKFGHLKIRDITSLYCQKVLNTWANEISAFNDYKIQTNLVFKYAFMHGLIEKNLSDKVVTPKKQNTLALFWSDIDFEGETPKWTASRRI